MGDPDMTVTTAMGEASKTGAHAAPDNAKATKFMFLLALVIVLAVAISVLLFGLVGLILSGVAATAFCMLLLVLMTAGG